MSMLLYLFHLAALSGVARPFSCPLPTNERIHILLLSVLLSSQGEGSDFTVNIHGDVHFTCHAVGDRKDEFRSLSVAVRYTKGENSTQLFRIQFQMECKVNNFISASDSGFEMNIQESIFNLTTRVDCRFCTSGYAPGVDTTANCYPCTSDCLLLGQGACRDEAGVVCCPFFSSEGNCTNTSTVASYSTISSIDFAFSSLTTSTSTPIHTVVLPRQLEPGILIAVISVILGVCIVVLMFLLVCIIGLAYWKVKKVSHTETANKNLVTAASYDHVGNTNKTGDAAAVSQPQHTEIPFATQVNCAYGVKKKLREPIYEEMIGRPKSKYVLINNPAYASSTVVTN